MNEPNAGRPPQSPWTAEPSSEPAAPPTNEPPPQGWPNAQPSSTGAPTKFCFACGATIDARAEICPKCGVRQPTLTGGAAPSAPFGGNDATTRTGKSRIAASLIAIFLGGLGIHKFYLGDTGLGVVYLLFFWTLIPAIVGLVEGIIWLTQSNELWLAKYGDR